jgi:hypothetical protein
MENKKKRTALHIFLHGTVKKSETYAKYFNSFG